ncbi:hypothetical protein Goklo_013793 [Gossypium klotzschianum]|uniref:Uncharacterized protein n=1 Tax=Gossypium klotzschianum TaxID=34286 RepID=A0A7J8U5G2_9ROSI|nr:hypothetical protein [Gossypium klotzschianum]
MCLLFFFLALFLCNLLPLLAGSCGLAQIA